MSERAKYPEMISRYNSGEMTPEEREHFEQLMAQDPHLRKEVELDKEIDNMLGDADLMDLRKKLNEAKKDFKRSRFDRNRGFLLMAASFLILIAAGIFLLMAGLRTFHNTSDTYAITDSMIYMGNPEDSIPGVKYKDPVRLANYRLNDQYEKMVGTFTRSTFFKQFQPKYFQKFKKNGNIIFEWTVVNNKKPRIIIVDNQGIEIVNHQPVTEQQYFLPIGPLHPGLYYYKMVEDSVVVSMGKFVVE